MAKDPRFSFYPDNYEGGTQLFTLEQDGAYLRLMLMQFRIGKFTESQAVDMLMQRYRGNTKASTAMWNFLRHKFDTDGELYWSARLAKEVDKSKTHSDKQSLRVQKRWNGIKSGNTTVLPDNRIGTGTGIRTKEEGGVGEETDTGEIVHTIRSEDRDPDNRIGTPRLALMSQDKFLKAMQAKFKIDRDELDFRLEQFSLKRLGESRLYTSIEQVKADFEYFLNNWQENDFKRPSGRNGYKTNATVNLKKIYGES